MLNISLRLDDDVNILLSVEQLIFTEETDGDLAKTLPHLLANFLYRFLDSGVHCAIDLLLNGQPDTVQ